MNKTLRIGHYEYILDSRLLHAPQNPITRETPWLTHVPSLQERLREVEEKRLAGLPYPSQVAPEAYLTEEREKREKEERKLAEIERRERNETENESVNGFHFRGCVFYRTPTIYSGFGLKSWIFRNSSKEYSFSIVDMRKRTARQNDLAIKGRDAALNAWMSPLNESPQNSVAALRNQEKRLSPPKW